MGKAKALVVGLVWSCPAESRGLLYRLEWEERLAFTGIR